ncbi:sulfur oxidation c-type cytochrome SoxA [Arcobacter sp. KX21116]|jgi:sulfur-oxidizing protein SoxA|uniref:sulfur oxidation c-type cytochrome SoxA n=1 Tax=Arcobacter iocasae TaxID=2906515 RepID=UPI0035D4AEA6
MLLKIAKTTALIALTVSAFNITLNAKDFSAQAEKDRVALVKYFETKFQDPLKNRAEFFPYATDDELENGIAKGLKFQDFALGNYSYNIDGKAQYEDLREMPPYDYDIDAGEVLWNKAFANGKSFATCFGTPDALSKYPYFDDARNQVVTLTQAVNECLTSNGEKAWNTKKGDMAKLQAYMAKSAQDEEKVIDVKIDSQAAADAYERGKEYYYTQRGYLKLNCAECHVGGAGKRVRNEKLSPFLGQVTHFPVYRLKWKGVGTLERRMSGCIKDQGQVPPADTSKDMKELLFFMSYMSNGMKLDGPDIRK